MDTVTELQKDIAEFNKAEVVKIKKTYKANYKGNQNDLNKFMSRVSYLEYCKSVKKNSRPIAKKEYNQFETADDIHAHLEKQQFLKPWSRLDNYCRKIKIKEYINNKINNGEFDKKYDYYFKEFNNLLEKKKLHKKNEISYDSKNGIILKIFNYC